jgi:hypothetical protein
VQPKAHSTRPDMSTFYNQLSQIETTTREDPSWRHNNPNSTPNPVEMAAAERLLQDQFTFYLEDATNPDRRAFLEDMRLQIERFIEQPPEVVKGVPQSFLDGLERVPKKQLKALGECPICAQEYAKDPYPLVVVLPCHPTHHFDLECIGPWLRLHGTCPLDRKDFAKKKEVPKRTKEEEEEDFDEMYA